VKAGASDPASACSKVDFPDPDGPITVSTSPGATSALISISV
jgi:hypothetical protein